MKFTVFERIAILAYLCKDCRWAQHKKLFDKMQFDEAEKGNLELIITTKSEPVNKPQPDVFYFRQFYKRTDEWKWKAGAIPIKSIRIVGKDRELVLEALTPIWNKIDKKEYESIGQITINEMV